MKIDKQRFTCKCGQVFDGDLVVDAPIAVVIASMRAVRCPACGKANPGLGGAYKDAPPLSASVEVRADWWERRGERGTSSNTIYAAFTGGATPQWAGVPRDPDDYRRCRQLLEVIPEWRQSLHVVAGRFPVFAPMVERWNEMDALYDEESPSGTCPKLFDLMQELRKQGERNA